MVLSTYLLHLLQSFLLLCWDEALFLSLEAIAAAQWKSKYLLILCHNWRGYLFLFGCEDSALKSNCASWVGTWKYKRNVFVWGTEWGLNSLSVFVLVATIHRQLLPTLKWHFLSLSIFWTDATHSSISWVLQPPDSSQPSVQIPIPPFFWPNYTFQQHLKVLINTWL